MILDLFSKFLRIPNSSVHPGYLLLAEKGTLTYLRLSFGETNALEVKGEPLAEPRRSRTNIRPLHSREPRKYFSSFRSKFDIPWSASLYLLSYLSFSFWHGSL